MKIFAGIVLVRKLIKTSGKNSNEIRLKKIYEELEHLITAYKPQIVVIEQLFFFKNQKTIMSVSEMRGVLLLTLAEHGIPVQEFTPLQVKQAVSGYGRSGKSQVELMVRVILNLKDEIKPDDAADGLAIAICCANTIIRG